MFDSKQAKAGPATVLAPPLRALPADTTARRGVLIPLRLRRGLLETRRPLRHCRCDGSYVVFAAPTAVLAVLIPLRLRRGLLETRRPLGRRTSLPKTPGRYGTLAAMAAISYSLRLARRSPRFLPV